MTAGDLDARLLGVARKAVDKRALGELYEVAITRQLDQLEQGTLARFNVIVSCDDPSALQKDAPKLDAFVTIFLCVPPERAIDEAVAACLENLVKQKRAKLPLGNGHGKLTMPGSLIIPGANGIN